MFKTFRITTLRHRPNMWIKIAILAAGLVAIVAGALPFLSGGFSGEDESVMMSHVVREGDLRVTVTENGMLESSANEEIKCMVKGGSTVLWVIETGTYVKPGDELVRLDTALIEDNITQQQINYERAVANQIIASSEVDVAITNIEEYINGTYLEERNLIEKQIFDAEELVKKAQLTYESAMRMASKGMYRTLQLEGEKFAVDSARKDLELKKKQLETLDKYKRKKTVQGLESALEASKARLAAEDAELKLQEDRLNRDKEQLENCVIRAKSEGMVIFPSAAEWKETPDIEEGAVVREQQTLLMIPDLTKMQVKVGVHESKVARLRIGMRADVELQDSNIRGEVEEIAEVTRPAGWWTGNMVKYDTIIRLRAQQGLKPGMSAIVDIVLAEHNGVLRLPVAAIVQSPAGYLCWVKSTSGPKKRLITLGDTNDEFSVVTSGLAAGDDVVLNPTAYIEDAQLEANRPMMQRGSEEDEEAAMGEGGAAKDAPATKDDSGGSKKAGGDSKGKKATKVSAGSQAVAGGDKNGDGVLTIDEFEEKDRDKFSMVDSNGDGKVNAREIDAALEAAGSQ